MPTKSFAKLSLNTTFCPDNCEVEDGEDIECNGLCGVDPLSERPFCQPSCDFNNGGCSDEEVCVQGRIFCIRSPCPQPVNCIPKTSECRIPCSVILFSEYLCKNIFCSPAGYQ